MQHSVTYDCDCVRGDGLVSLSLILRVVPKLVAVAHYFTCCTDANNIDNSFIFGSRHSRASTMRQISCTFAR